MRSTDFSPIVSPIGTGALARGSRKAKGGSAPKKSGKPSAHLLIILMPHPDVTGALGHQAGIRPMRGGRK